VIGGAEVAMALAVFISKNGKHVLHACCFHERTMLPSSRARRSHYPAIMARSSLAARVAALEEQMGNKTMEEHFREQAELIDRRLDESFRSQAELIDRLFLARDQKWDVRFGRIEKDMRIVREGIGILLKRRG
jgi:hypothetical protein